MNRATDEESRACPGRLRRSPPTQPSSEGERPASSVMLPGMPSEIATPRARSSVRVRGARVLRRLSGGGRRGKQATDEAEQLNVLGPMLNNYRSDVREPS